MEKREILERSKLEEFKNLVNQPLFQLIIWNPSSIDFRKEENWVIRVYQNDQPTRVTVTEKQYLYFTRDRDQDEIVASHFSCEDRRWDNSYDQESL